MLLLAVLAVLALGIVIGGAGMKRLGRLAGRVAGRWRPGVGVGAILLTFAALAVSVRGAWTVGIPLLLAAAGMAVTARRRTANPEPVGSMSEAEARSILGLQPGATAADIKAAYVRLMQRAHPDHGGTSGLASQLNAARARLLG